jgi:hypothetical protein
MTEEGERLAWHGDLTLQPLRSEGALELKGVKARTLWRYFQDQLGFEVAAGTFDLSASYRFEAGVAPPELEISQGAFELKGLGVTARGDDTVVPGIPELAIRDASASLRRAEVVVGRIELRGSRLVAWRDPDGRLNFETMLGRPVAAAPTTGTQASPPEPPAAGERRAER